MVELPSYPRRMALSKAPESMVSAADIQGPAAALGGAMKNVGAAIEEGLTPLAEQVGRDSVVRNADGSVSVQPVLALGRLGDVARASQEKVFRTQMNSTLQTDLQALAQRTMLPASEGGGDGDPEWFRKQAADYVSQRAANQRGGMQDYARLEGQTMADQYLRGLSNQRFQRDSQRDLQTFNARLDMLNVDLSNLAAQGGTGTEEFQKAWSERRSIRQQMVADPRFAYTAAKAEADDRNDLASLQAEAIIGTARRQYEKTGNLAAVQQDAEKALDALSMEPGRKISFLGLIGRNLATANAARQAQVDTLKQEAGELKFRMERNGSFDNRDVDRVADELERLGARAAASELRAARMLAGLLPAIKFGTPGDAAATLRQATGGGSSYVERVFGKESSFDPNARNPNSTATGLGQFTIGTWRGLMQRYPDLGLTENGRTDPGQVMRAMIPFTNENANMLGRSGFEATEKNLYLAHFLGAGGSVTFLRAMQANPGQPAADVLPEAAASNRQVFYKSDGSPRSLAEVYNVQTARFPGTPAVFGSGSPAGPTIDGLRANPYAARVMEGVQAAYDLRTREVWQDIAGAYDRGYQPRPQDLADLATLLPLTSDAKLRADVAERLNAEAAKGAIASAPLVAMQGILQQAESTAKAGLASPAEIRIVEDLRRMTAERQKTLAENPVDAAPALTDQRQLAPLAPFDFSSSAAFRAGLMARIEVLDVLKKIEPASGDNPLKRGEAEMIASVLPNLPATETRLVLETITATLSPAQLAATMENDALRRAVVGLTMTLDPAKMAVGYGVLDVLDRANPLRFRATFGEDMAKQLDVWKTKTSYLPADVVAKQIQRSQDPTYVAALKEVEKRADEITKGTTSKELTRIFEAGSIWDSATWKPIREVATTESGVDQGRLISEYRELFRSYYIEFGTEKLAKEQAVRRLSEKWGPSEVAAPVGERRLMKFPPEKMYPAIDGSHDWIKTQLQDSIREAVGDMGLMERYGARTFFLPAMALQAEMARQKSDKFTPEQERAYQRFTAPNVLISDAQTEADVSAKRDPSYGVAIQIHGRWEVLTNSDGKALRFRPERGPAADRSDGQFERNRQLVLPTEQRDLGRRSNFQRAGEVGPALRPEQ